MRPDFALTPDNTGAVAAICRQLDGLPLAIELIASRIRLMSPQSLLTHLTSDFTLHADGMRGVPARQKTLHNAIAWSYDRLSQEEQVLLARLAVFAGGFTLDAAQVVTQMPHVINGVMSLSDKSLLVKTIDAQGEHAVQPIGDDSRLRASIGCAIETKKRHCAIGIWHYFLRSCRASRQSDARAGSNRVG